MKSKSCQRNCVWCTFRIVHHSYSFVYDWWFGWKSYV